MRIHLSAADLCDNFLETANARGAGVHHFDLPALALGVAVVHAKEIRRKEGCLVAAGAGPDFQKDVFLVVRVPGQKLDADGPLQFWLARLKRFQLRPGKRNQFRVFLGLRQLAAAGDLGQQFFVLPIQCGHPGHLGVLPHRGAVLVLTSQQLRIGEPPLQRRQFFTDIGKLLKHGRKKSVTCPYRMGTGHGG